MPNKTVIYYYITQKGDNPVKDFLDNLSFKQQTKVLRIFQCIKEYGLQSVLTHIKKLSGLSLWEIRIIGKDNIRFIYFIRQKNSVLVLHGFLKKTNKTPQKELKVALMRLRDWKIRFSN